MKEYRTNSHAVYDIKYHIHALISCPPTIAPAKIMQYLKGRSSRILQDDFPELKRR